MPDNLLRKKLLILGFLFLIIFSIPTTFAANPASLIVPNDNIFDPGASTTPWGGCGPKDTNCYVQKKGDTNKKNPLTSFTIQGSDNSFVKTTNGNTTTSNNTSNVTVSNKSILSALRNLLSNLPKDILEKLRGPAGPKGDSGLSVQTTSSSSGYTPLPLVYLPGAIIPPNPATNYSGGSLFSATNLSSSNFNSSNITTSALAVNGTSNLTGTLNVNGTSSLTGNLNVTGDSLFTGNVNVVGTLSSSLSTTLATGLNTLNTFGSGASSINVIGSTTTPGTLTLHGATILDNSFSQTGENTFNTGTGAVNLNGDTTIIGSKTFNTGSGNANFNNITTNFAALNPIIDTTEGTSTLNINTVNNRPVTFGTGTVTIPNLSVSNSQTSAGTFSIDSNATTQTIFSVTGNSLTSGTGIAKIITANAGNGQVTKGELLTLTDATTAGGGFTGIGINVTGAGTGSGNKYLLKLKPVTATNEVVFDNTGAFRPTTSSVSNTNTIGSPTYYWKNGYFDQITVNSLVGNVTAGSTSSNTYTIGSNEAGDTNKALIFQRNSGSGNATLQWNSGSNDLRYLSVNYPFNSTYTVRDSSIDTNVNLYSGLLTNNTTSGTQTLLSLTNTGTGTTEKGIYVNNTGTGTTAFEIGGTWTNGIVTNNNNINAGTGTVTASSFVGNVTGTVSSISNHASTELSDTSSIVYLNNSGNTGAIIATGTINAGYTANLGIGTRMMWYPRKGSFRAGTVSGTQWDDSNIGLFSTATGQNTTASGQGSVAMGEDTTASGQGSVAIGGNNTNAGGDYSVALGNNSNAGGYASISMGSSTNANSDHAIAFGNSATANGQSSIAIGENTNANSDYSVAIGNNVNANGNYSTAMGQDTNADAYGSFATGQYNIGGGDNGSWNQNESLFEIGNGDNDGNRNNALTLLKNGTFKLNGANDFGNGTQFNDNLIVDNQGGFNIFGTVNNGNNDTWQNQTLAVSAYGNLTLTGKQWGNDGVGDNNQTNDTLNIDRLGFFNLFGTTIDPNNNINQNNTFIVRANGSFDFYGAATDQNDNLNSNGTLGVSENGTLTLNGSFDRGNGNGMETSNNLQINQFGNALFSGSVDNNDGGSLAGQTLQINPYGDLSLLGKIQNSDSGVYDVSRQTLNVTSSGQFNIYGTEYNSNNFSMFQHQTFGIDTNGGLILIGKQYDNNSGASHSNNTLSISPYGTFNLYGSINDENGDLEHFTSLQDNFNGEFILRSTVGGDISGTERFHITGSNDIANAYFSNSKVGIGIAIPTQALDVVGNVNISSGSKYKINGVDLSYSDVGAQVAGSYLTSLSGALLATGATTGATSSAQAFTNGVKTGKIFPSANSTTALQFNKADGTTNILNIDTTNSRVGIGTNGPTQNLQVNGTSGLPNNSGTTSNALFRLYGTGGVILDMGVNGSSPYQSWIQATDPSGLQNIYPLLLNPNGGNVGIGTTTPNQNLEVSSTGNNPTIRINSSSGAGANEPKLQFFNGNVSGNYVISELGAKAGTGFANSLLTFRVADASKVLQDRMVVDNTGNIGIGTTSPQQKLDIYNGDLRFSIVADPIAPTGVVSSGAGLTDASDYYYKVQYMVGSKWTSMSPASSAIHTTSPNDRVTLTIPTSSESVVTARKIFRTKANLPNNGYYLVTTISDNTTTSYIDSTADGSLPALVYSSTSGDIDNTTGGTIWMNGNGRGFFGSSNLSFGTNFANVTTANRNVGIGPGAISALTTGYENVAVGQQAMNSLTIGSANVAIGRNSNGTTTGSNNIAIGRYSLGSVGASSYNIGIGSYALNQNAGNYNTAMGIEVMQNNTSGNNNTAIGYHAGYTSVSGSSNVFLGYNAGYYETGSNKLFIDNATRASEADARTKALVYGVFDASTANQIFAINGNVGIGTTGPAGILDISGSSSGTDSTVFVGARALSLINTDTTTNNMSGFDFRTNDLAGTLTTGSKIMGIYTSHTTNAVSGDLSFLTRNAGTITEKMRILSNGYVGIGTTTPTAITEINGPASTAGAQNLSTVNSSTTVTTTSSAFANIQIGAQIIANATTRYVVAKTDNNTITVNSAVDWSTGYSFTYKNPLLKISDNTTNQIIIRPDGTVGLGTSTPAVNLDVTGSGAELFRVTRTGSSVFRVQNGGTRLLIGNDKTSTGDLGFFVVGNTTPAVLIDTSGNLGIGSAAPASKLDINSSDLGNGVAGPVITLGRNTNATNTGAGSINFLSKGGTAGYVWQDAAGKIRINTAAPTNALDTNGTVLGDQTSTRDTKQDIADYTDYANALKMVTDAPLHTFRYIKEVQGYGTDSPLAKTRIGYIADEVNPMFMVGNSIDQVSVNGLLIASVKELNIKIEDLAKAKLNSPTDTNDTTYAFFTNVVTKVENSVAYMKGLAIDTLKIGSPQKRTGITLYDEITGAPYCLSVANGTTKTTSGECGIIEANTETNITPAPTPASPAPTNENTTPIIPDPAPTPETTQSTPTPVPNVTIPTPTETPAPTPTPASASVPETTQPAPTPEVVPVSIPTQ